MTRTNHTYQYPIIHFHYSTLLRYHMLYGIFRLCHYQLLDKIFKQAYILNVIGTKRKGTDIHFLDSLVELSHLHIHRLTITREQDITTYHLLLQWSLSIITIIDGITITVHLIDSIVRRNIHPIAQLTSNTILCIKEIRHLHVFLKIILGKLQYDVRFLRYGWHNEVSHTDVIVHSLRILRIIDKFRQLYTVLSEENARMFPLAQFPSKQAIQLHTIAMFYSIIPKSELLLYDMAHLNETPYLVKRGDVFRL